MLSHGGAECPLNNGQSVEDLHDVDDDDDDDQNDDASTRLPSSRRHDDEQMRMNNSFTKDGDNDHQSRAKKKNRTETPSPLITETPFTFSDIRRGVAMDDYQKQTLKRRCVQDWLKGLIDGSRFSQQQGEECRFLFTRPKVFHIPKDKHSQIRNNMKSTSSPKTQLQTNWYRVHIKKQVPDTMAFLIRFGK